MRRLSHEFCEGCLVFPHGECPCLIAQKLGPKRVAYESVGTLQLTLYRPGLADETQDGPPALAWKVRGECQVFALTVKLHERPPRNLGQGDRASQHRHKSLLKLE